MGDKRIPTVNRVHYIPQAVQDWGANLEALRSVSRRCPAGIRHSDRKAVKQCPDLADIEVVLVIFGCA